MNFRLPLLQVGGRGEAGYTIMLPIQRKWRVNKVVTDSRIGCEACEEHIVTYSINANSDWWHPEIGEFGPGMMLARYSGFNLIQGCFADSRHWQKALTRLTFTTADGTEYEFRDKDHGGAPRDVPSCNQGASRGRVFVTADGSSATFISDTTIFDAVSPVPPDSYFVVSGYLLLRNGTRYRIDEGKVTWIRDRNGNQTRFEPGKIIDPLNREITFSYEHNGIGILLAKQIGFKGFNGTSRTIRIVYDDLPNALRPANAQHPAETIKTFGELFPGITDWGQGGNSAGEEFFTRVVSRVILPDGRSYRFYYNSYAELARVELPTGGAFEYDWTGDVVNMGGTFDLGPNYEIYRQLAERRVYRDGSALEGRTTLGACSDLPGAGLICRQVDQVDPTNGNSLLARTKHFYFGSSGPIGLFKEEIHYSKWNEGKEFKTEVFATNGTTVLHRTETNWVQRTSVSWWAPNSTLFGPEPSMDPRVSFINTTLPDVNKVSRQEFFYDDSLPFNNAADVYEYDFGLGGPGTLIRRTHTSYVTAANYAGTDGLAVYAGTAAHIRSLPSEKWVSSDANGAIRRSFTTFEYDNYTADSTHAFLIPRSDITGLCTTFGSNGVCANVAPQTYVTRGNPTSVTSYMQPASPATGPVTVAMQYDIAGNMIKFLDPRSIASGLYYATTIDYSDRFGGPDHEARGNTGPAELNGNPLKHTNAFATLITNPLGHTAYSQFDYYLGQPVNAEDENGTVVSGRYDDTLDRPTQVKRAVNVSGLESQTTFAYNDTARTVTTSSDRDGLNDNILISQLVYDPLGRTVEARQYEGNGNFIVTKTEYDALGRVSKTSNPYRPQSEGAQWTVTVFDGMGRVSSVTTPDGSIANTSYSGNSATVTDRAGKRRKSVTDAVGRLVEVYEDPNMPGPPTELNFQTTYLYDALDNLVKVTQGGQQRFFMYDSLGRLIRSRHPEQATLTSLNLSDPITNNSAWSIGYQYDQGGNLTQKTDARGVVSTYAYDRLNRNTTTDYSDTTSINPDVSRLYDGATKGIGKFWSSEAGGTEKTVFAEYDELGRPLALQQSFKIPNNTWKLYQTSRSYNLAGSVKTQSYPSTHSVTYNYDAAGRVAEKDPLNPAFKGNLGDGNSPRTYSKGIIYAPGGQLAQEQFGTATSVYNKRFYNSRQQLAEILVSTTVGSDSWDRGKIRNQYSLQCSGPSCNATDNNGNLRKQEIFIPSVNPQVPATSWHQQYDYDELNRLKRVREFTGNTLLDWQQEFDYDRWGNRTINATGTWIGNQNNPSDPPLNEKQFDTNILASTNRLQAPGDQPLPENQKRMRYDGAGNLINDTYIGVGERVYDAENRMIKAWGGDNQWQFYTYNADGQRTRRKINNQETWLVYGFDGELLAEYPAEGATNNPTKEYGYRNGQLLISADAGFSLASPVFADDFNDNSLNTSFWTTHSPGSPTVSEQGQQLQIALAPNTAGYNGVFSNSTNDLTNRMVQVESVQAVSQAGWCENFLQLELNANNYFMIQVGAGNMIFRSRVNGVNDQTVIQFDGAANRFWRIRHDQSANLVHFETSAAGSVWLIRKSVTPGLALTALRFHLIAGAYGTGNSSPGTAKYDNFKLLSSATGSVSLTVPNSGFEAPVIGNGNWQFAPSGGSWSFANGAGISGMNSAFTGVPSSAPQGVQVAFLQATGEVSQSISGFQASTDYVITFNAIQRTNCCNAGGQDIGVYVDSIQIGSVHPGSASYTEYSFPFTTTPGAHTIKFVGLNPLGGDHTAFIDNVRITGSPKPGFGIQWLVADQLGTPRLILDETGLLANVKRHDYLPFGEELMSLGLRNASLGYATGDGIRQQFTSKERDVETGLDYFLARYYSPIHGRFLSPDEFSGGPSDISVLGSGSSEKQALAYATVSNPQSLNKYQYGFNNPLRFVDPDGHKPQEGLEIRMRRNEKDFASGKITREEFIARVRAEGVGGLIGLSAVLSYLYGPQIAVAVVAWAMRNPDKVQQVGQMFLEGAGGPPGLTLAPNSRLRATEIDSLERLAKQIGKRLLESPHVAEEVIIAGTQKTIDVMGHAKAFSHPNFKLTEFFKSIDDHLAKSVDQIAIDLKGASKEQIKAITDYVRKLEKGAQDRIIWIQP